MNTKTLTFDEAVSRLRQQTVPAHAEGYLAMYSSEWDALVSDPRLMRVPVDDHLVHRGDGVFETLLWQAGRLYNLEAHLNRLQHSAASIGLQCPATPEKLKDILRDLCGLAGKERFLVRLLLGRGPGGFGVDPGECPEPSLYAVAYEGSPSFMVRHPEGATVILSRIPPKSGGLATIKTCNYLPNALMKAEAAAAGAHFALGVDAEGFLTESYTENIMAVTPDGELVIPPPENHLPGTTLQRVADLAQQEGFTILHQKIRPEELEKMSELLILGTTACVTSVTQFETLKFPVGPIGRKLSELLDRDLESGR
jgi:branched-chain amino acid aminotransferase